jgi:hypothetical protein
LWFESFEEFRLTLALAILVRRIASHYHFGLMFELDSRKSDISGPVRRFAIIRLQYTPQAIELVIAISGILMLLRLRMTVILIRMISFLVHKYLNLQITLVLLTAWQIDREIGESTCPVTRC